MQKSDGAHIGIPSHPGVGRVPPEVRRGDAENDDETPEAASARGEVEPRLRRVALLDGLALGPVSAATEQALAEAGLSGPVHHLRRERFAPCQGCWQCWVQSPGRCTINDEANGVMADAIGADAVLWTTELTFGCWDPVAKAALDRSIGLLSPFFRTIAGETHHRRRYRRYPRWGVLAVERPDTSPAERDLFRRLVTRNAINMHGGAPWVGFVPAYADRRAVQSMVRAGLEALAAPAEDPAEPQAPFAPRAGAVGVARPENRPPHAVLWVGSARPAGESTSEALGRRLVTQLEARGWTWEVVHVARTVRLAREQSPALLAAVRRADLLVPATPVYVDAVPALVLAGLCHLVGEDLGRKPPAMLPIVQCGFPEVGHTALALEVLSQAADRLGMGWAGHLAMGSGGLVAGRPMEDAGRQLAHQVGALDAAAAALDAGDPVPAAVTARFAEVPVPPGLYRLIGNVGWLAAAVKRGSLFDLWDRPFEEAPPG